MKDRTVAARTSLPRHLRDAAQQRIDRPAPLVSAVIPTYNRAPLVTRAIESVLGQTFRDLELVVVDDASPDDTPAALARFKDPRLRYIRLPKNKGQWHAENVGIAHARGEWVAFLDDDDEWLPDKIAKQLERAVLTGYDVIYCRALPDRRREQAIGSVPPPFEEGDVTKALFSGRLISTPTVFMVRRDALIGVGGFDESLPGAQDTDLWYRLALAGHRFGAVQDRLAAYHNDHPGRQSDDDVRTVRSRFVYSRRWAHFKREAMGDDGYRIWLRRSDKANRKGIGKLVRRIERSGSRSEALRYVRRMTPVWPWGTAFYSRVVAVVVFGRLPYRISRVRQGKSGAPWLRRLFGAG